ncbi:cadherin domain-containing protein [Myxosarcina sp. GI1]|uniref:cadherin domain-containing protein n=1 Tax=Myxosarcina sp. GI1 TaxID=1541065 RepID=UPI000AF1EC45|nr:cadherin domain-containing protein [Myxosarcina sp. GI1]
MTLNNATFNGNEVAGGEGGNSNAVTDDGQGLGGAIFALNTLDNGNGNNLGMPDSLPTVTVNGITYTNNIAPNDAGTATDNDDYYGVAPNVSPSITSNNTANLDENTTEVITVTADDPDGDVVTYSISGGNDNTLFSIDSDTGVLSFNTAPDYENPGDNDSDNVYEVEVTVSDGSASQTQNLLVTVSNANETPAIVSSDTVNLEENTTEVITVTADDPDGDSLNYSISGGSDNSLFSIDSDTGVLSFNTAPDYENPGDNNSDNVYEVEVTVSDDDLTKTQNLLITVDNVNELSIASNKTVDFYGDTNEVIAVTAEEPDVGDIVTYSISGGVDSNLFSIDPDSGILIFNTIPDYENPSDSDLDNVYEVEVTVSDGDLTKTQNLIITAKDPDSVLTPVIDLDDSENIIAGNVFDNPSVGIAANSSNPNNDTITYSLLDDFNGAFAIDSDTGVVTLADPLALNYGVGQEYNITVEASDGVTTVSNDFVITPDTVSILSSLINRDNLIQLTNEFLSLIPEFTLNYSEIAENLLEKLEISIDSFLGGEIELDLANTLGYTNTESTEYKLLGAIVDTIDGTEEGVTDTTLNIQGLSYSSESTPDDLTTPEIYDPITQSVDFAVTVNEQDFIYSKDETGYQLSYGGSVDVLALIRTLANETGIVELPEGFSLNVSGFNLSSTFDEETDTETLNLSIESLNNGETGLNLAALFGISDTNSTNYKLIEAVASTIDSNSVDTVLNIQGLSYSSESTPDDLTTPEIYDPITQSVDFAVTINEQDFIYSKDETGYQLSYGGSVDVLALIRTLANETGIVELPEGFSLNVSGFNLSSTFDEDADLETVNLTIDSLSNSDEGLNLAALFGITDPNSGSYKLVQAIAQTIDSSSVDTVLKISDISYRSESTLDDPTTTDINESEIQSLDFGLKIEDEDGVEQDLVYSQSDSGYSFSYGGSIDVLAIIRTLANNTGLVELPDEFSLNVSGFDFSTTIDEDAELETVNLTIDSLSNGEEGLRLASLFGNPPPDSGSYKLVQAIAQTIDSSSVDTVLKISDISYRSESTLDDPTTTDINESEIQSLDFGLKIEDEDGVEQDLVYSQSDSGYSFSYGGSIDVLAIIRTLANNTGLVELPDEFSLNVSGFDFSTTKEEFETTTNLTIGEVSNGEDGLDLASFFGLTAADNETFTYKLIGGLVDTIDGDKDNIEGEIDTVLALNGLEYQTIEISNDPETRDIDETASSLDLTLDIDENQFVYSQESVKTKVSYDGVVNALALLKVLVDQTGIIDLPDNLAFDVDGFEVDLTKDEITNKIVEYDLFVNVPKTSIVNLFESLEVPDFINSFVDAIAADLEFNIGSDAVGFNYQGTLDISGIIASILSGFGLDTQLEPLSVNNANILITKNELQERIYEVAIESVAPGEIITFLADLVGAGLSDETKNKLSNVGDVSLVLSNEGIILSYQDDITIDLGNILSGDGGIPFVEDIIDEIVTRFLGTEEITFSQSQFGITEENNKTVLSLVSLLNDKEISLDYSDRNTTFGYEIGELDFATIAPDIAILKDFKLDNVDLLIAEADETVDYEGLGSIDLVKGVNLIGQLNFTNSESEVIKYINNDLGIDNLDVALGIGADDGVGFKGKVDGNISLLSLGDSAEDLNLKLNEIALGFLIGSELSPKFTIEAILALSGYDPFQENEPTLSLAGALALDTQSSIASFALEPESPWINPFGIPDTEIRTLAFQLETIYTPPSSTIGFLADLKWGAINVDFAFTYNPTNPLQNAVLLTLNESVSLIELWTVPASPFIGDLGIVTDGLELLDSIIDLEVVSFDRDKDGKLDPLIKYVPFATEIAGNVIEEGFEINAEITAWGAAARLDLQASPDYTSFEGSLQIPEISFDIGDFNILTLGGYDPNADDTDKTLDDPNLANSSLDLEFKISTEEIYLRGDGSLSILGTQVANAAFSIGTEEINIQDFDINLFEVITLDVDNFYLNFNTYSGSGAAALTFFGQSLADVDFTIENGSYFELNVNQLGFGDFLAFQDVNLTLDFEEPSASAEGSLVLLGQEVASAAMAINPDGIVIDNVNLDLGIASFEVEELSLTGLETNEPAFKANAGFEILGQTMSSIDIEYADDIFNAQDVVLGFGDIASIQIPELYIDFNSSEFDAEGELVVLGATLASVDAEYQDEALDIDTFWGVDMSLPVVGDIKIGVNIGLSSTETTSNYSFAFVFWDVEYEIEVQLDKTIPEMIAEILDPVLAAFEAVGEAIGAVFDAVGGAFSAIGNFVGEAFSFIFGPDNDSEYDELDNDFDDPDEFDGGGGDDTIKGLGGNDTITGGDGRDEIDGGNDNDSLLGGSDNDRIIGGNGNDSLLGEGGNDSLYGYADDDLILGGSGEDSIHGDGGNDTLLGEDGRDYLDGFEGNDTISGGNDNDTIRGSDGNDVIAGDEGNDVIAGNNNDDTISGGEGDDSLEGNSGNDVIAGDEGNDTISGGEGDDVITGGEGNDSIQGNLGYDTIAGGEGDDVISGNEGKDVLSGSQGNDTIDGNSEADIILGGEGDDLITGDAPETEGFSDTLDGGAGDDTIYGYGASDIIYGGSGNDSILGGEGNDNIYGGDGVDSIEGEAGNDNIEGGSGNDLLIGNLGDDIIAGGDNDDSLEGNEGNDYLAGGSDRDTLVGNVGDDTLEGGTGSDSLEGGTGNDYLFGEDNATSSEEETEENPTINNDTLIGGEGDDTLIGGKGDDLLINDAGVDYFDGGEGRDTLDLSSETDNLKIDLNRNRITRNSSEIVEQFSNIEEFVSGSGNDIIIGDSNDNNLDAGAGNDLIDVTEGLEVTTGNDTILGGDGDDTLVLADTTEDYNYSQLSNIILITDNNNQVKTVNGVEQFFFDDGILTPDSFKDRANYNDLLDGNFDSLEEFLSIVRVLVNDGLYNLLPDLTVNLNQINGFNLGFQKQAENVDLAMGIGQLANEEFGIQESTSNLAEILNLDDATTLTEIFDRLTDSETGLGLEELLGIEDTPLIAETIRGVLGVVDSTGLGNSLIDGLNQSGGDTNSDGDTTQNSPFTGVGLTVDSILDNPDTVLNESEDNLTFSIGINDAKFNIGRGFSGDNSYNNYNFGYDGTVDIVALIRDLLNSTDLVNLPPEVSLAVEDFEVSYTEETGVNPSETLALSVGQISNTSEGLDLAAMFGIQSDSFMYQIIGGIVDTIDGTEIGVTDTTLDLNDLSFEMNRRYDLLSLQNENETDYSLNIGIDDNDFVWKQSPNSYEISYDGTIDTLAMLRGLVNSTNLFTIPQDFSFNVDGFYIDFSKEKTLLDRDLPSFLQDDAEKEVTETFNFGIGAIRNGESGLDLAKLFGIKDTNSFGYQLISGLVDTVDGSEVGVDDTTLNISSLDFSMDEVYTINTETPTSSKNIEFDLGIDDNNFIWSQSPDGWSVSYDGTIDLLALSRGFINGIAPNTLPEEYAFNINGFGTSYTESEFQDVLELNVGGISNTESGLDIAKMLGLTDTTSVGYQLIEGFVNTIDGNEIGVSDTEIAFNGLDLILTNDRDNPETTEIDETARSIAFNLNLDENLLTWNQNSDGWQLSYDGTTDALALVRVLANSTGLFNLPETFALNVDTFDIGFTETETEEKFNLSFGEVSNGDSGIDLAAMFGITDINSFDYRLVMAIVNTIAGTGAEITEPIINLDGADFNFAKDKETGEQSIGLNIDTGRNKFVWEQSKDNFELSYDGTIDVFALIRFAGQEINLFDVPDEFALNVNGFSVRSFQNNAEKTLEQLVIPMMD